MKLITQDELRHIAGDIIARGKLRYKFEKAKYMAVINEVSFHKDGVCVLVTGEFQTLTEEGWNPALENCPAFHRFKFTRASPRWVKDEDSDNEIIQIDTDDGPIYILFSDIPKGSEA